MGPENFERDINKLKEEAARLHVTQAGCEEKYSPATPVCREQTSREVLADHLRSLEQEYADLDELRKALPLELGYQADRALRRLIQAARR